MSKQRYAFTTFLNRLFTSICFVDVGYLFCKLNKYKFNSFKFLMVALIVVASLVVVQYLVSSRDESIIKHTKSKFFYIKIVLMYLLYYLIIAVLTYFIIKFYK